MNRRQLFKKMAGIAGAVLAAPVMAKEIAEQDSVIGIKSTCIAQPTGLGLAYNPGVKALPALGQMAYMADGTCRIWNGERWVSCQYDTLDGQHGSYYTSTH